MTDTPLKLPELADTYLDPRTLDQLFIDIETCATVLAVVARGHAEQRSMDGGLQLGSGRDLFLSRQVQGIQIRYLHHGSEWWDTLMHTPKGVRLVRIEHPIESPADT